MGVLDKVRAAEAGEIVKDRGEKSSVAGLEIRVAKDGKKTWRLYYRSRTGAVRRPKIGTFPAITLSKAREVASEWLVRVARGEDPSEEFQRARAELTVGKLWLLVKAKHYALAPGGGREAGYTYEKWIAPTWAATPLSGVRPLAVSNWRDSLRANISTSRINNVLGVFKRLFSWAEEQEIIELGKDPLKRVKKFGLVKRSRFATDEEIQTIVAVLKANANEDPTGVAFLWVGMLTGARPKVLLEATWGQLQETTVKGQRAGLLSLAGKTSEATGEDDQIVLPLAALRILDALPRNPDDPRIFQRTIVPKSIWRKVRKQLRRPDLRVRDLRRTFATLAFSGGVDEGVVSKLLGHKSAQTTKIYALLKLAPRLEGAKVAGEQLDAIVLAGDGERRNPATMT